MSPHGVRKLASAFLTAAIYRAPRPFLAATLSLGCIFPGGFGLPISAASSSPAADKKHKPDPALKNLPITELTADEAILHALNRLAYGPRPGDLERIKQMGLAKWIDQQLNPNSIDDKALDARLEDYPTLKMSTEKLIAEYPQPKQQEKQQEKQAAKRAQAQAEQLPPTPQTRGDQAAAVISRDMVPASTRSQTSPPSPDPDAEAKDFVASLAGGGTPSANAPAAGALVAVAKPGRASDCSGSGCRPIDSSADSSTTPPATPASQSSTNDATATSSPNAPSPMKDDPAPNPPAVKGGKRDLLGGDPNNIPRNIAEDSKRPPRIVAELSMAKVTRAIYSQRQLRQVMDDFWFNHLNVFAGKGEDRYYLTSYERDVIQPHTLGKFKDLITASAKSPAMLFYLDNFLSADPRAAQREAQERYARQMARYRGFGPPPVPPNAQKKKNDRGLNENYGRELMELHTLGVDGGYTQKDVTEVARCFTGWTIEKPRIHPEFKFDERLHDPDPKLVLGKTIHAGGMKDGEEVIDLLAHHPSTAKFISTKLARRFVSDNPPPALVARMSQTFLDSDGDIKAVLHTMIYSPDFWSRAAYRAKIKTPFELVVSAARALGTDVDMPQPLVGWISRIGEPLYQCQPPTGYADKAEAWVNTGALLNRLNFSLALAGNKMRGSRTDVASLLGPDSSDAKGALNGADSSGGAKGDGTGSSAEARVALERAVQLFLGGQAAPSTVETLEKQLDNPQVVQAKLDDPVKQVDLGVVAGLVLGAPEFQRR
jgi:uncharacterized protein (DUF1800 family)